MNATHKKPSSDVAQATPVHADMISDVYSDMLINFDEIAGIDLRSLQCSEIFMHDHKQYEIEWLTKVVVHSRRKQRKACPSD